MTEETTPLEYNELRIVRHTARFGNLYTFSVLCQEYSDQGSRFDLDIGGVRGI